MSTTKFVDGESEMLTSTISSQVISDQEGFDTNITFEYCSLLKNGTSHWEFPIDCWKRNIPHFSSIDGSMTNHWDDLFSKYYSPQSRCRDDSNSIVELSPVKRKRKVKEPEIISRDIFDGEDDSTEPESSDNTNLNEGDSFLGRNSKKTKHVHAN